MKRIILFNCFIIGLFIVLFLGVTQALAQATSTQKTPEQIAAEKGITFPIAELGNCSDFNACRTFCEDPVNQGTCIDFAKKKGFHKEESSVKKDEIINAAKNALGCDSEESCRSYCSQEANYDNCSSFAQKHNLSGGQTADPSKSQILEKAKRILGCDSPSSCRSLCEEEANRQRCSDFARESGLRGGEHQAGPGGCTSEESCKTFCSDPANFQVCSKFQSSVGGDTRDFKGPGGCNSEESCRTYCQSHPNECGSYGGESGQEAKDYADFCRQNPEECGPGQSGGFENSQKREDFEKFCRENPEKCGGISQPTGGYSTPTGSALPQGGYNPPPSGGYSTDPATGCTQAGGSWINGSCQFSGSSNTTSSSPPPASTTQSTPPPTTQTETQYQTQPSPYPTTQPTGTVQGASTQNNFLQTFFQILLSFP